MGFHQLWRLRYGSMASHLNQVENKKLELANRGRNLSLWNFGGKPPPQPSRSPTLVIDVSTTLWYTCCWRNKCVFDNNFSLTQPLSTIQFKALEIQKGHRTPLCLSHNKFLQIGASLSMVGSNLILMEVLKTILEWQGPVVSRNNRGYWIMGFTSWIDICTVLVAVNRGAFIKGYIRLLGKVDRRIVLESDQNTQLVKWQTPFPIRSKQSNYSSLQGSTW